MIKLKELFLFGVAGVIGYLGDVFTTLLLHGILGVYVARLPAFVVATTLTWIFNRNITFSVHRSHHESLIKEYFHYTSLMIFGLIVNYIVYAVSITIIGHGKFAIFICVGLGSLSGMAVNYLSSKKYLFNIKKEL